MNSLLRTVPSLLMRKSKITIIFDGNYSLNYAELKLRIQLDKKCSKYKGFALLQICINQSQHFKGWKTPNSPKNWLHFFIQQSWSIFLDFWLLPLYFNYVLKLLQLHWPPLKVPSPPQPKSQHQLAQKHLLTLPLPLLPQRINKSRQLMLLQLQSSPTQPPQMPQEQPPLRG